MIKNFSDWLRALPVAKRILVVVALVIVLWFVVLPLVGELLTFLRDAAIVFVLPWACLLFCLIVGIAAFSPPAGKALTKLVSVTVGASVNAIVQVTLAACGYKEKKKDDKDKKKNDGDDDDDDS